MGWPVFSWDAFAAFKRKGQFDRLRVGKGENFVEIDENGVLRLHGQARQVCDINIPLSNLATGSSTPDVIPLFGSSILGYGFAGGTSGPSDEVHGSCEEVPHWADMATYLEFHLHFNPETAVGTTNKKSKWYYELGFGNPRQAPTILTGTAIHEMDDNTVAWAGQYLTLRTVAAPNLTLGSRLHFMIRRVRDADNTYTSRLHPCSAGFHILSNGFGSQTAQVKG